MCSIMAVTYPDIEHSRLQPELAGQLVGGFRLVGGHGMLCRQQFRRLLRLLQRQCGRRIVPSASRS